MKDLISNEKESKSCNNYVILKDSIIFMDPIFILIYKKIIEGYNIKQIIELPSDLFPNSLKPDIKSIEHYFRKCEFFNQHYQKKITERERFISVNGKDIESTLANLNQITFEVTDSCNLNCKYCGYGDFYNVFDARKNYKLNINSAKTILEYLITLWNSNLNISHKQNITIGFYGGEPLMNMDFINQVVDFIRSKPLSHNYVTYSMTTNGFLLRKHLDYLVKNNFRLVISLDGDISNNSYRVLHNGEGSFNAVYKNAKYAKEKYPEYFDKMINFNSVLHKKNSVSEIYNFINKEFGKLPFIAELNTVGIKPDMRKEFFETYQNKYESLMQAEDYTHIKKDMFYRVGEPLEVGTFLQQYSGNVFHDYNDFFIDKDSIGRIPTGTCFPFRKKMFVTVNGKILACERIGHQFALGKVTPENVDLDFEKIAAMYNNYYSKIISQCNLCFNVESCVQCIFNIEDIETIPVCESFLNMQQFNGKVNFTMSCLEADPILYDKIIRELIIEM